MTSDARKREWKPGDVAMTIEHSFGAANRVALRRRDGWTDSDGRFWQPDEVLARPLVVIDPEDREQVERLVVAIVSAGGLTGGELIQTGVRIAQAALREFANPTPAKPEEPTGLGAVVEDANGDLWIYNGTSPAGIQRWSTPYGSSVAYADIAAVRVLSDGVQP